MKILLFCLLCSFCLLSLEAQGEKSITILHTNDLHSRLAGFSPEKKYSPLIANNDPTIGGFARIAAIIKQEKENNPGTTIAIDAGDFLMGTLFHGLEVETGFQLPLMRKMGYDLTCLGNHEFDFGPEKLSTLINNSVSGGEIPVFLSGNIVFDSKDSKDDGLEKLYHNGTLEPKHIVESDGIKIGFFSILGKDAANVAPNAAPVSFSKQVSFARKMVKELRADNCDIIICISHSGLSKKTDGIWAGEDYKLAKSVKGINLIISGHTHTKLNKPLIVNGIPIVQTGAYGAYLGRLSLKYSSGNISVESYKLIPVDDKIIGDKQINSLIEEQKNRISKNILAPLGLSYDKPVMEASFTLEGGETGNFMESNMGPLVADAIQYYVNSESNDGTDLSLVAVGVIRDRIVPGEQAAPDIFRVMSLGSGKDDVPGYPLSRLYVTGRELKSILEILQVAYKSSSDNYCYYSGIKVEYDPDKGLLRKISKIDIVSNEGESREVDFSKRNSTLYSITANSYMLQFIGIIKKMSFGLINVVPKDHNGNPVTDMQTAVIDMDEKANGIQEGKEWLALIYYFKSMKDSTGNGIPDLDAKYSVPVKCFFPVSSK